MCWTGRQANTIPDDYQADWKVASEIILPVPESPPRSTEVKG
jgi:hypothetical protein